MEKELYKHMPSVVLFVLAIIFIVVSVPYTLTKSYFDEKRRIKNFEITLGSVYSSYQAYKSSRCYEYRFTARKKSYQGIACNVGNKTNHATFIIIYEKDDPQNKEVISKSSQFAKYGLTMPDSLKNLCSEE